MQMPPVLKCPITLLFLVNAASTYHHITITQTVRGGLGPVDCEGYGRVMPHRGVLHVFMSASDSVSAALVRVVSNP
jgi:hypothetical protein